MLKIIPMHFSPAEVNKDSKSKKMREAEKFNIPVVSEDYLEAVKKGGAMLMISQHSIVSWGKKKVCQPGRPIYRGSCDT